MTSTQNASWQVIQCEGEVGIAQAAELKNAIAAGLSEGRNIELDLRQVVEIDLTTLQVLVAAGREAAAQEPRIVMRASDAVRAAARESGFAALPEFGIERQTGTEAKCPK